jgi:hypothetical protein
MTELSFCTIGIVNGILVLRYKEKHVSLEDCQQYYEWCQKNIPGQKLPSLNVLHPNNSFSDEAKRFSANEGTDFSMAEAFVVENGIIRILANFYMRFNKPKVITKIFTKEQDATEWLRTFL